MARAGTLIPNNLGGRCLVLTGLMGAGKSTIGKRVASILNLPFYDSDAEIEKAAQMSVSELFMLYGELEFRALEKRVIKRLLEEGPMVLALGGGAYVQDETRALIQNQAITVWIKVSFDVLMGRVLQRSHRPLLQQGDPYATMARLLEERYPIYAQADLIVYSGKARRHIMARKIIQAVARYLSTERKL